MLEKTYISCGGVDKDLDNTEIEELFSSALSNAIADVNSSGKVVILPPDITRYHSQAGFITEIASRQLSNIQNKDKLGAILPALGTHMAMNDEEIKYMFGSTPRDKFIVHDWRNDIAELGRIEEDWVEKTSEGAVRYDWPVQVNKILHKNNPSSGDFSLTLSIGQVVPHEVAGMANHAKNLFVGTGGKEAIDKSHFIGAAYGMERIMGKADTPVRALFDEGLKRFGSELPPILWVLTVISARTLVEASLNGKEPGTLAVRGLYIGFGRECFEKAAKLSREVNVNLMDEPVKKAVVYLEPQEYRTTWLGNKAVYRTRMVIADGGELVVLAPALERFGEDKGIDALIRKHGYRPAKEILSKVANDRELGQNLSAAAHLIHGSSENRFTIRYCPGKKVTRKEIEAAGFEWGDIKEMQERYDISKLSPGWNTHSDGENFFYVPNPALGLWAEKSKF
ncbi:MAG: lactate racemase domain-containing protein [Treponema sp.]|jgi:nickel-dependent lactate racemase|nr:lactate racemase domain-containing protein [Treponema sp.]